MAAKNGEDKFYNEYLAMKPHGGGFFDLFHLLFSGNIEKNNYVDCTEGMKMAELERRRILFISLIAQKTLLFLGKPMSWFGWMFDTLLNILCNNSNFTALLSNLLRAKLVLPDKNSATYRSSIGNIDTRLELDKNIKDGDCRYYGAISAMAAKLSYENEAFVQTTVTNQWKMKFLGFYNFWNDYQDRSSTYAFMFQDQMEDPELIVVAFRGTEPFDADAWITDVEISWYDLSDLGKIHGGFMKALGLQKGKGWPKEIEQKENDRRLYAYYTLREKLREILKKNEKAKVIVTGHSLGGALAILFSVVLVLHKEDWILKRFEGVYTFGQPRVGDEKLGEYMTKEFKDHDVKYFRYVYCNDMVPRLPFDDKTLLFKHFGICIYFSSIYQGKVVVEEPNKNYFSVIKAVPMMLNAFWELVRSFMIGYIKGDCYCEGWFLRLFRVAGLIIPGLSAHCPQDYVNATRLGFEVIPLQLQEDPNQDLISEQEIRRTKDMTKKKQDSISEQKIRGTKDMAKEKSDLVSEQEIQKTEDTSKEKSDLILEQEIRGTEDIENEKSDLVSEQEIQGTEDMAKEKSDLTSKQEIQGTEDITKKKSGDPENWEASITELRGQIQELASTVRHLVGISQGQVAVAPPTAVGTTVPVIQKI